MPKKDPKAGEHQWPQSEPGATVNVNPPYTEPDVPGNMENAPTDTPPGAKSTRTTGEGVGIAGSKGRDQRPKGSATGKTTGQEPEGRK